MALRTFYIPPFAVSCEGWGTRARSGWRCPWAVDVDIGVVEEGDFVGEHEFGDGEVVLLCGGEEVCGAAEGVGDSAGAGEAFGGALGFGDDEASADGVEDYFGERCAGVVEGGEAHAVGVGVDLGVGVHLVAAEVEVFGFDEGDGFAAGELERAGGADGGDLCFDGGGVDGVGASPRRPRRMARSVPWPMPVRASEP